MSFLVPPVGVHLVAATAAAATRERQSDEPANMGDTTMAERDRREERSARTLGWGKPMVMGWAFLTKMNSGKSRRE